MTISEHLMRPGSGSVQFADVPVSVSKAILDAVDESQGGPGAHIVITPTPMDPLAFGDSAMLAAAVYTGRIVARPSRSSLEFVGLGSWLDTYLDSTLTKTAGTPTQWLTDLLTNGLTVGSVSGGSNVSRTLPAHVASRRECLDSIAGLGGWEYRIQPDFTVDAGTSVFVTTPEVVVTRKAEGPDGEVRGVDGSLLDQKIDTKSTATKAVALAQGQGSAIVKGTATTSVSLKTRSGGTPELVTVLSAPSEESANANTSASNFLNLQGLRREVAVSSRTHNLRRYVTPGDYVYLYDLAAGLVDTTNQVQFRGETIFPAEVRCLSITWLIEEGMGVYVRPNAASPTWVDVTPWVMWESGDTWWTVGDWSPGSYGRTNRSNPEVEQRIGNDGVWTDFKSGVSLQQNGVNRSATITRASYVRNGRMITGNIYIVVTGAGALGTIAVLDGGVLPDPATNGGQCVGGFRYFDSGTTNYCGAVNWDGSQFVFVGDQLGSDLGNGFAVANGDALSFTFCFEAAS